MATYKYRAQTAFYLSTGYPNEEYGVNPTDNSWHTGEEGVKYTNRRKYYYRDSDNALDPNYNNNSSKVEVDIEDSWTAKYDSSNTLQVSATTTIISIKRLDIRGNPIGQFNRKRNIYIRRNIGGGVIKSFTNLPIEVSQTISGKIDLGTDTINIAPGGGSERGTVYYLSCVPGYENVSLPNDFVDAMWMGTSFQNTQSAPPPTPPAPTDYRPGAVYNGSTWMSHNRENEWYGSGTGMCNINTGGSWLEMRTDNGGVGSGDLPNIYNGRWVNMLKMGRDQDPPPPPEDDDDD